MNGQRRNQIENFDLLIIWCVFIFLLGVCVLCIRCQVQVPSQFLSTLGDCCSSIRAPGKLLRLGWCLSIAVSHRTACRVLTFRRHLESFKLSKSLRNLDSYVDLNWLSVKERWWEMSVKVLIFFLRAAGGRCTWPRWPEATWVEGKFEDEALIGLKTRKLIIWLCIRRQNYKFVDQKSSRGKAISCGSDFASLFCPRSCHATR